MNFGFTEEQEMLRNQVSRFMQEDCAMTTVREIASADPAFSGPLWEKMAQLGWLGLIIPEEFGGVGLRWVDLTVVLEETARGLSPLPLLSNTLAAAALLRCGDAAQQQAWLPGLADGSRVATVALYDEPNWIDEAAVTLVSNDGKLSGSKPYVPDAGGADLFIIAFRDGAANNELKLGLLDRDTKGLSVTGQPIMDRTKPMGTLVLDDVLLASDRVLSLAEGDLTFLTDCGAVGVTAEMVGAADAALAITTDYAKERVQFGSLIGKYQGVKHRLADMYVDIESFRSLLYYAAWTVDEAPEELSRAVSLAKGYASDAFAQIGIDAVQLHGAIGFTAEYDIQLYLKRSKWARPMFGDTDFHYDRVAALGGL